MRVSCGVKCKLGSSPRKSLSMNSYTPESWKLRCWLYISRARQKGEEKKTITISVMGSDSCGSENELSSQRRKTIYLFEIRAVHNCAARKIHHAVCRFKIEKTTSYKCSITKIHLLQGDMPDSSNAITTSKSTYLTVVKYMSHILFIR